MPDGHGGTAGAARRTGGRRPRRRGAHGRARRPRVERGLTDPSASLGGPTRLRLRSVSSSRERSRIAHRGRRPRLPVRRLRGRSRRARRPSPITATAATRRPGRRRARSPTRRRTACRARSRSARRSRTGRDASRRGRATRRGAVARRRRRGRGSAAALRRRGVTAESAPGAAAGADETVRAGADARGRRRRATPTPTRSDRDPPPRTTTTARSAATRPATGPRRRRGSRAPRPAARRDAESEPPTFLASRSRAGPGPRRAAPPISWPAGAAARPPRRRSGCGAWSAGGGCERCGGGCSRRRRVAGARRPATAHDDDRARDLPRPRRTAAPAARLRPAPRRAVERPGLGAAAPLRGLPDDPDPGRHAADPAARR